MRLFLIGAFVIVCFFGDHLYSLNVDMAHHFSAIDALMKYGTTSFPHLGFMSSYPTLSYWLAAYPGHALGSGLLGMVIVSVLAIYTAYYFAADLLRSAGARLSSFLAFIGAIWTLSYWRVPTGFEIMNDSFYAQLVATSLFFLGIFLLAKTKPNWVSVVGALGGTYIILSSHPVPAAALVGTLAVAMSSHLALEALHERHVDKTLLLNLIALLLGSIATLVIHPSFSQFGPVVGSDGHISVPLPISVTVVFGIVSSAAAGWRIVRDGDRRNAAIIIFGKYPLDTS